MRTLIFTFTTFLRFCSQSCELMVSLSNSNLPMLGKVLPAVRYDNWTDQISMLMTIILKLNIIE